MCACLCKGILHQFKTLHRTRLNTFKGDENALKVIRAKINEEYRKYKDVTNQGAIKELNKFAQEVEHELRLSVIQAIEKEPGVYKLRITPNVLLDNATCGDISSSNNSQSKLVNKKSVCRENIEKS